MTIEAVIDGQKWTGEGTLNQGDMKLNLKVDSEFTGKHYTLDFDLNPAGTWGLHVTGDVDGPGPPWSAAPCCCPRRWFHRQSPGPPPQAPPGSASCSSAAAFWAAANSASFSTR